MTPQIQAKVGFSGFAKQISTPNIALPLQTNAMIVVIIGGMNNLSPDNTVIKNGASVGTNQPAQSVQDNMGNSYYRVNSVNNNSQLMNPLLYEEIWIATINSPILRNIVVTVTYPSTTLFAGEVIIVTPQNPQNQLDYDDSVLTADNIANVFGNIGLVTSSNNGEPIVPTLANELIILGINYVFSNQPPTSTPTLPSINGIGPTSLLDNSSVVQAITSVATGGVSNTYGFGIATLSQLISGNTLVNWNVTTQGQSVCSWITLVIAIQEVPVATLGVQESVIPSPFSPESVSLIATNVPGVNIIKLPLGS